MSDSVHDLTPDELLTTTRAVRRRLDLTRPVERDVVESCLRIGFQAPNGQNRQDWGWVVVDDVATRQQMAEIYRRGLADRLARSSAATTPTPEPTAAGQRISESVSHLIERMQDVPVLLVPTIADHYAEQTAFSEASKWGSILPAVWNFMLALRSRQMGSAWTTLHLYREGEMAELLDIPTDQRQVGLFPVAYTIGTDFKPADRTASDARIFWNRWTG